MILYKNRAILTELLTFKFQYDIVKTALEIFLKQIIMTGELR